MEVNGQFQDLRRCTPGRIIPVLMEQEAGWGGGPRAGEVGLVRVPTKVRRSDVCCGADVLHLQ